VSPWQRQERKLRKHVKVCGMERRVLVHALGQCSIVNSLSLFCLLHLSAERVAMKHYCNAALGQERILNGE
jgi:hypothetical protein